MIPLRWTRESFEISNGRDLNSVHLHTNTLLPSSGITGINYGWFIVKRFATAMELPDFDYITSSSGWDRQFLEMASRISRLNMPVGVALRSKWAIMSLHGWLRDRIMLPFSHQTGQNCCLSRRRQCHGFLYTSVRKGASNTCTLFVRLVFAYGWAWWPSLNQNQHENAISAPVLKSRLVSASPYCTLWPRWKCIVKPFDFDVQVTKGCEWNNRSEQSQSGLTT